MKKSAGIMSLVFLLALLWGGQTSVSAAVVEQFQVSPGVKYQKNQEVINSYNQQVRVMEVNMNDSYTQLDLSFPNPLNSLMTTSKQAKLNTTDKHRVVGAVNGSFFDMSAKIPMYLISYNNRLINSGIIASGKDQYVNQPIAFGIDKLGNPLIDTFTLGLSLTHKANTYEISGINKVRNNDNLILYTPENEGGYTNTNPYGMEVIFTSASKNKELAFGDTITGTVSAIKPYGDQTNTQVPADGFVLSAHGDKLAILKAMSIGEEIEIQINIDDKWKDSKYMVASGPMLVNNGKVELGMDPNSSRAKERAPRTAIAIDKTMSKVFLVTVDGRNTNSKGMNLTEFAQYLVKVGAYKALNLDGGGSTAMVVRKQGDEYATLINQPSDGVERSVSTTFQAISTAPLGTPSYMNLSLSKSGDMLIGSEVTVNTTVMDQYFNKLSVDSSKLSLSTELGTVKGNVVTLSKAGKGYITAKYGSITKQIPITVVTEISKFSDVPASYKFYPEIKYLTDRNIITGYTDGTFRPSNSLKRVDAALLLVRSLGLDAKNPPDVQFADVPKTYRYYNEVAAVAGAKIMNGKSGNKFDLNAPLTRAEMAVILERAFELKGSTNVEFKDVKPGSFGYDAIKLLIANKITEGYDDNTFRPGEAVTRVQYALFLYRGLTN